MPTLIVAPTYERYCDYIRESDARASRYISRPDQLRGYSNAEVIFLGTPVGLSVRDEVELLDRIQLIRHWSKL